MSAFEPGRLARLLAAVGGDPEAAPAMAEDLVARYAEPHRRYHSAEHVTEVLDEIDRLASATGGRTSTVEPTVELAALFHDAVYDVHASGGESEAASAVLAVDRLLAAGLDSAHPALDEVRRLILLTAGHQVDGADRAGSLLIDADLWILSAPVDRYDRYAEAVHTEYAHIPDDLWVAGRSPVLQHFLDASDDLYGYGSEGDRAGRRERATANLHRELIALGEDT